jgi:nicotinamide-nucleotide amidase
VSSQLAAQVIIELQRRSETVATAESLTGGLLAMLLTEAPGASVGYLGGVISYATRLKDTLAGVSPATLQAVGPVAERTAAEMAQGICRRCQADWGMATTGVAGPEPQDGHPVGEVFVAVAHPASGLVRVKALSLTGDRMTIRATAAANAVELLAEALEIAAETWVQFAHAIRSPGTADAVARADRGVAARGAGGPGPDAA